MYDLTFVDVSQFVTEPIRTGVQRVLVQILQHLPRNRIMPFRVLGKQAAILDPAILDVFVRFFRKRSLSDRSIFARNHGIDATFSDEEDLIRMIGGSPLALVDANRFFFRAQRVINLEAFSCPHRARFYIGCPPAYRRKVAHFVHDFLLFEKPQVFPQLNWRYAVDNVLLFEAYCAAGQYFVSTPTMRKKVARYFNRPVTEVAVVHFGGDLSALPAAATGLPVTSGRRRRVLVVGTIEPRKYPEEVVRALDEVAERHPDTDCIMAGSMGWLTPEVQANIEAILDAKRVTHLPMLGDAELAELMAGADVAVYVSSAEGFGLPVIEYASRGIPQVTNAAVPSAALVNGGHGRAVVLKEVTVATLVDAIEKQLATPQVRVPYYDWTWEDCAAEIAAWRPEMDVMDPAPIDSATCWSVSVSLVRELRDHPTDWEGLKARVGFRLQPAIGENALTTEVVEQMSEIVADNIKLVYWADKLAIEGLLYDAVCCATSTSHLEGIGRAYQSFLGRPMDARAATEVVRIGDVERRLQRMLELVHSDEASKHLPAVTRIAFHHLLKQVSGLLECVASSRLDLMRLCEVLEIAPPSLDDVIQAEEMRMAGVSTLAVVLYFANRRKASGEDMDFMLEVMAKAERSAHLLTQQRDYQWFPTGRRASGSQLESAPAAAEQSLPEARTAGRESDQDVVAMSRRLPLYSSLLTDGWFDVESGEKPYRWMSKVATVVNPEPLRELDHVRLSILMVYGADEPLLTAAIDGDPVDVAVNRPDSGEGWLVTIMADPEKTRHDVLSIQALVTDSPSRAENKNDDRQLSFAITDCVFEYR